MFQLVENPRFVLVFPLPDPFHQFLTAQVVTRLTFLLEQPPLDDGLRRDTGMIGAGQPERIKALHALETNQDVLQCVVQGVTQMECAGNIWRRDHDGKWLFRWIGNGVKIASRFPHLIQPVLRGREIKAIGNGIGRDRGSHRHILGG